MGCHNFLLDHDDDVKLYDFVGSSIDGEMLTCYYESRASYILSLEAPRNGKWRLLGLGLRVLHWELRSSRSRRVNRWGTPTYE